MRRIVTVLEMVPREVRCVVLAEHPVVVLRHATLLERFMFWISERQPVSALISECTSWRARAIAKDVIEKARG